MLQPFCIMRANGFVEPGYIMRRSVSAVALLIALGLPAAAQQAAPDAKPQTPASEAPAAPAAPVAPPVAATAPEPQGQTADKAKPAVKKVVKKAPPPPPKERGVISNDPTPTLTQDTARLTAEAAQRYRAIADRGGWPSLPKQQLSMGAKGAAVATLRSRLAIEGDLASDSGSNVFDKDLQQAVKAYQARQGFVQNGVVAGSTLAALNIPAEVRARQLHQSALRLSDVNLSFGERYVVVNIPAASVETVENGAVRRRYVAVVGKPENASPTVTTRITNVNINPTWTVPTSIIKNEFIPKMRANPGYASYFNRANIRILDRNGGSIPASSIDWSSNQAVNYTFRQDSGASNSLGQIRIDMPNAHSVYMHDTPSKRFFNAQDRFFSHGCVRVQDVKALAAWLLEGTSGNWEKSSIDAAIAIGERKDVRLAKPVPVAWVYMTGYVSDDGKVHFRDDVYSLDSGAGAAMAQAKRVQKRQQQEAKAAAAATVGAESTASIPTAAPQRGTGQFIDQAEQDAPQQKPQKRGWMLW